MKTISTLIGLLALAWSVHAQVGPTAIVLVTNVTQRPITLTVTTTQIVQRSTAPVFWNGTTNWVVKDKVLSERNVTNAVDRGGRQAKLKP